MNIETLTTPPEDHKNFWSDLGHILAKIGLTTAKAGAEAGTIAATTVIKTSLPGGLGQSIGDEVGTELGGLVDKIPGGTTIQKITTPDTTVAAAIAEVAVIVAQVKATSTAVASLAASIQEISAAIQSLTVLEPDFKTLVSEMAEIRQAVLTATAPAAPAADPNINIEDRAQQIAAEAIQKATDLVTQAKARTAEEFGSESKAYKAIWPDQVAA